MKVSLHGPRRLNGGGRWSWVGEAIALVCCQVVVESGNRQLMINIFNLVIVSMNLSFV